MIISALLIFGLRIVDVTLYTLRLRMLLRGRKRLAWVFGFLQPLVYVSALGTLLSNLANGLSGLNILGYAAGFATGLVVGMLLEDHLAIGYTHLRIVSQRRGIETAERLRGAGYGVTEVSANGLEGAVSVIHCTVLRKNEDAVMGIINESDPEAFVTAESVRQVQKGFWLG